MIPLISFLGLMVAGLLAIGVIVVGGGLALVFLIDCIRMSNSSHLAEAKAEEAIVLLREVHDNNLNGLLYSGPTRRRVAEFLGSPDEWHVGDGLMAAQPLPEFPTDRCRVCGWPLAESIAEGCVSGNCSQRPTPATRADAGYAPEGQ